ncbi:MAG: hypothetical protein Q3961_05295 [Bifidobacteriaceae bacterium]|nr:hypothetical protein [Bifidobacteriaceae bacterium]
MGLHICLRVRDSLQSQELLNSPCAANIPPSLPGAAYCHDGEIIRAFRTAACKQPQHVIRSTLYTARMMNIQPAPALFTEPLPRNISLPENNENNYNCILDNGTHTSHYNILDKAQNCMFIGNKQCGKTNALSILVSQSVQKGKRVRHSYYIEHKWIHREYNQPHANTTNQIMHEYSGNLNNTIQEVWCIDDVDNFSHMYDNKNIALADEILHALQNTQTQVILTCNNVPKQFLQYCDTTLVFPTGDYAQDCTNGISRTIFQNITLDATYPGRCVLIQQNKQYLIQFFKKMHVES